MQDGFGLLEIITALGLISFALLGLMQGLLWAQQQALEGEALTLITLQAENSYEKMRADSLTAQTAE